MNKTPKKIVDRCDPLRHATGTRQATRVEMFGKKKGRKSRRIR